MIETWALFQGIHLSRARHVRRLALQLYSGLRPGSSSHSRGERNILHLASILQQSGRAKNASSFDLSFASGLPQESLSTAVTVIRGLREKANFFEGKQQEPATELCGILRLARALSRGSGQSVRSLKVHHGPDSIIISASGYSELSPMAEKVSRARYLLEYVYQKPVLIRGVSATNYHEDPDGNS